MRLHTMIESGHRGIAWAEAERLFALRAGDARFLLGTFLDRQEGASDAHPYRRALDVHHPPPKDKSHLHTATSDGRSRRDLYRLQKSDLLEIFHKKAGQVRDRAYRPEILQGARWQKNPSSGKWRTIYYPTEPDKVVAAVFLEILEPLLDPVIHICQHGYRSSKVMGAPCTIPGFKNARGSIEIVGERLIRGINTGKFFVAYGDAKNAFLAVDRDLLRSRLVEDGASSIFGTQIVDILGTRAICPWLPKSTPDDQVIKVTGIPLGSPIGPLLFNFYVAYVHTGGMALGGHGVPIVSYADDFWLLSDDINSLEKGVDVVTQRFTDIHMEVDFTITDLRRESLEILKQGRISKITTDNRGRERSRISWKKKK